MLTVILGKSMLISITSTAKTAAKSSLQHQSIAPGAMHVLKNTTNTLLSLRTVLGNPTSKITFGLCFV